MSTKTSDTNQISYDPQSQGVYNSLQGNIGSTLTQFMNNPLVASFFNQRVGMGNKQISQQGAGAMQSMMNNFRANGQAGSTTNNFLQSQILRQGRATQGAMSNNFLTQLQNANNLQVGATGMAQAYNPLMTGSTGTQTTSGVGTWLPQLLSAAGGGAGGASQSPAMGGPGTPLWNPGGSFGSALPPSLGSVGAFPSSSLPDVYGGFNPLAGVIPPAPSYINPSGMWGGN